MAIKKSCDNCDIVLGRDGSPFLQLHGTLSQQIEDGKGILMYKYLTNYSQNKLAFCNTSCLTLWIENQRANKEYRTKELSTVDGGMVVHT